MKERKMNNKGFSLVELIIVIAIMAILIVVLAPQYLKYVEKSRNSTDVTNATEMVTALQVYASDPEATSAFTSGDTFTISVGTATNITGSAAAKATSALTSAGINTTNTTCQSKTLWEAYSITGTVQPDGSITFTYGQTNGTANAFSDRMTGKSGT